MRPRVGLRNFVSRLKHVVLPAPFGPIKACTAPRATLRLTPLTATKPAKSLVRSSVSRMVSALIGSAFPWPSPALSSPVSLGRQGSAPIPSAPVSRIPNRYHRPAALTRTARRSSANGLRPQIRKPYRRLSGTLIVRDGWHVSPALEGKSKCCSNRRDCGRSPHERRPVAQADHL